MAFVFAERLEKRHMEPRVYAIFLQDRFVGSNIELVVAFSLEEAIEAARHNTKQKFIADGVPAQLMDRVNFRPDMWVVKSIHELFGGVLTQQIEEVPQGPVKAPKKKKTK